MVALLENDVEKMKSALNELKTKRRELDPQLAEACPPLVPVDPAGEGRISKLLGGLYKKPLSAPATPNRAGLIAEAEALDEAIARLAETYRDARQRADDERVGQLRPSYLEAVLHLQRAIDEAIRCNEVVSDLERRMGYRPTTMSWTALIPPGGPFRTTIGEWRDRVAGFLNS